MAVDLSSPEGVDIVLKLCETADVMVQNFRPGVVDRLGVGPTAAMARFWPTRSPLYAIGVSFDEHLVKDRAPFGRTET